MYKAIPVKHLADVAAAAVPRWSARRRSPATAAALCMSAGGTASIARHLCIRRCTIGSNPTRLTRGNILRTDARDACR